MHTLAEIGAAADYLPPELPELGKLMREQTDDLIVKDDAGMRRIREDKSGCTSSQRLALYGWFHTQELKPDYTPRLISRCSHARA